MPDVLIRGLDDTMHAELKRRAKSAGVSMQTYITRLLSEHLARQPVDVWLQQLDELPAVEDVSGADAVAAAREELP